MTVFEAFADGFGLFKVSDIFNFQSEYGNKKIPFFRA
jgi:hypothetical protein